jgi:hypothetical protein
MELVDVVVDELLVTGTAGSVVLVVVVEDVCAKAVVSANALTAPAANNLINLFCFMFVLCLVKRMISVVHSSDCSKLEFIQPHLLFVIHRRSGRPSP